MTQLATIDLTGIQTVQDMKNAVDRIHEVVQGVMEQGVHFGIVPGTDKPTLLKPGAEKLLRAPEQPFVKRRLLILIAKRKLLRQFVRARVIE